MVVPFTTIRPNLNPALNQSEMRFYEKSNKGKNDAMFFEKCNDFIIYIHVANHILTSLEGLSMINDMFGMG